MFQKPEDQISSYNRAKFFIWNLLSQEFKPTLIGKIFNNFISCLIIISVIHTVIDSEPEVYNFFSHPFFLISYQIFRLFSTEVFMVEYALKVITCTESIKYKRFGPVFGRLRFLFSLRAIIDFLSILPSLISIILMSKQFYLEGKIQLDDSHASALSFFRMLRLLRLGSKSRTINMIRRLIKRQYRDVMSSSIVVIVSWLTMSMLLYFAERERQPEYFGSITESMWFAAVTMTTIGYGDVAPKTVLGKILTIAFGIMALVFFSLFVSIIGNAYMEEVSIYNRKKGKEQDTSRQRHVDLLNVLDHLRQKIDDLSTSSLQNIQQKHTCPNCNHRFVSNQPSNTPH
ncbi:potassium channel protein [Acrasis kona]|uniref:Potassium channel protein n=1 Tax=Acrasis kona TaxID=1008807 RepID=A0AAW2ZHL2_9EUKA